MNEGILPFVLSAILLVIGSADTSGERRPSTNSESPSGEKRLVFLDMEGTGSTGIGVAFGVIFGATRSGKGLGVQLAKHIQKRKECSHVEVTAREEKADYSLVVDPLQYGWVVYRSDGSIVDSGDTNRLSTLAKEACRTITSDRKTEPGAVEK